MQDMYTPIPVPASLKEYKSFEFLQRDLRVTGASPSAGSLHGGQVRTRLCPVGCSSCVSVCIQNSLLPHANISWPSQTPAAPSRLIFCFDEHVSTRVVTRNMGFFVSRRSTPMNDA